MIIGLLLHVLYVEKIYAQYNYILYNNYLLYNIRYNLISYLHKLFFQLRYETFSTSLSVSLL